MSMVSKSASRKPRGLQPRQKISVRVFERNFFVRQLRVEIGGSPPRIEEPAVVADHHAVGIDPALASSQVCRASLASRTSVLS